MYICLFAYNLIETRFYIYIYVCEKHGCLGFCFVGEGLGDGSTDFGMVLKDLGGILTRVLKKVLAVCSWVALRWYTNTNTNKNTNTNTHVLYVLEGTVLFPLVFVLHF